MNKPLTLNSTGLGIVPFFSPFDCFHSDGITSSPVRVHVIADIGQSYAHAPTYILIESVDYTTSISFENSTLHGAESD